eukprot:scaffold381_cov178-Amphora_coffeaeformis.AAC.28
MTPLQSQFLSATQNATEESHGQQNSRWQKDLSFRSDFKSSHSVMQSAMVRDLIASCSLLMVPTAYFSKQSLGRLSYTTPSGKKRGAWKRSLLGETSAGLLSNPTDRTSNGL